MDENHFSCVALHLKCDNIAYIFKSKANGTQSFIEHIIIDKTVIASWLLGPYGPQAIKFT